MKKILYLLLTTFFLTISCNNSDKKKSSTKNISSELVVKKLASIETNIEGMTCEIGCAKIIESKISKLPGVSFSKVNFQLKKGYFTYNENLISKEEITEKINKIAGGNLYHVTMTKELDTIINKE